MSRIPTQKLNFKEKAKAKIDSFTHYQPTGGQSTVGSVKLNYKHQAKSKVGSLINLNHKPKGGEKKVYWMNTSMPPQFHVIETHSLSFYDFSLIQIYQEKLHFKERASSRIGSLDNVTHKPGGGVNKVIKCLHILTE